MSLSLFVVWSSLSVSLLGVGCVCIGVIVSCVFVYAVWFSLCVFVIVCWSLGCVCMGVFVGCVFVYLPFFWEVLVCFFFNFIGLFCISNCLSMLVCVILCVCSCACLYVCVFVIVFLCMWPCVFLCLCVLVFVQWLSFPCPKPDA